MKVEIHTDDLELEAETDIEREILREWVEGGDMVWRMPEYSPNHKQGHLCGTFDVTDLPNRADIVFGYYAKHPNYGKEDPK